MTHKIARVLLVCLLLAILALPVAAVGVSYHNHQPHFSLSETAGKGAVPVLIACDPQSSNQGCSGG